VISMTTGPIKSAFRTRFHFAGPRDIQRVGRRTKIFQSGHSAEKGYQVPNMYEDAERCRQRSWSRCKAAQGVAYLWDRVKAARRSGLGEISKSWAEGQGATLRPDYARFAPGERQWLGSSGMMVRLEPQAAVAPTSRPPA